jgi:hypothetical protein
MRKSLLLVLAAVLLLGVVPASAATETSGVACTDADGRERLTLDGATATFEAPFAAPLLAATSEFTTAIADYRRALWQYQADLSPVSAATVTIDLSWADGVSDYDIYVSDVDGVELGRSDKINAADQDFTEQVSFDIGHCDVFTVAVSNFAGQPLQALDLGITVAATSGAKSLACLDGDTAPGCAGKLAGEAPAPAADDRTIYYLGGDLGQGAMVHTQAGAEEVPFRSGLTTERPTTAQPNSYTAPPVGFNAYRNPFQAYFGTAFDEPRAIVGDVSALVWVSSRTMNQGGTLVAELFADGGSVGRVEIPGAEIGEVPTPLALRFEDLNLPEVYDLTFQLAKEPIASSNGTTSDPGNATFTVTYGSVQFPSRVTLP